MPNTTATGGILTQVSGPLEGQALRRFMQQFLAHATGLPGEMVRPMYQEKPAADPDADADWLSFAETSRTPDADAFTHLELSRAHYGSSGSIRHSQMEIAIQIYGPNSMGIASRLRDSFTWNQNRDTLVAAGFGFLRMGQLVQLPDLSAAGMYRQRTDTTLNLRREERREYRVLYFEGGSVDLTAEPSGPELIHSSTVL